ncbi:MAG: hypothetical protein R3C59_19430 [Planctomycetaceae bacterium]
MFDFPKWLPRRGGGQRRGVEVNTAGVMTWASLREGDARTTSVFVNMRDLNLVSMNTSVVEARYGRGGGSGYYPVILTPTGTGTTTVLAINGALPSVLNIAVYPQRTLTVAFRKVRTAAWTAHATDAYASNLIDVANALYRYQGNLRLRKFGPIDTVEIPGLPAAVDRGGAAGFESWSCHVHGSADITVFFVPDYENSAAGGGQWAGQFRNWMVFEPSISANMSGMVFAHEMGHFFGLNHPSPSLPNNLLNQSSVGDRHRYRSFLNRTQIETITDRSNWDNRTVNVCLAASAAANALKGLLKNFGN